MFNRLYFDIQIECLKYLNIVELIKIKGVSRQFNEVANVAIKSRINRDRVIRPIISDVSERIVISGSFLLQMLIGEKFGGSDVDIFCNEDQEGKLDEIFEGYEKKNIRKTTRYFGTMPGTKHLLNIKRIIHYIKDGVVYECIMIIDKVNIKSFIGYSFDLDIVRNYISNDGIKIFNINSIITRTEYLHINQIDGFKMRSRIKKYHNRGFNFIIETKMEKSSGSMKFKKKCYRQMI